jgi:hypothetical protein
MEIKRFIWTENNIAHIARHDLTPIKIEEVFSAKDFIWSAIEDNYPRRIGHGTSQRGTVRVVFAFDQGECYVITAFNINPKRRK